MVSLSAMTLKYQSLPGKDEIIAHTPSSCFRLSRWKILSLVSIASVALFIAVYQCVNPHAFTGRVFCCSKQPPSIKKGGFLQDVDYEDSQEGASRIRYKHTQRRYPQAIIIGVRKGGTRALLEYLNLHPCIQAQKKELHFFDDDDTYSLGLEWYRKKMPFSFPDQFTIVKTPAYFTEEVVPERVYRMNKTVKLLLIVRDPTLRAISDYSQIHANKMEKGKDHDPFEELAIDEETGEVRKSYNAIRRSLYYRHMERWLEWFPLNQFHIVDGDRLVSDPVIELKKVETFLSIEHKLTEDYFYFNKTRGFYCIKNESTQKCLAQSKGRQHPYVREDVVKKIKEFFKPYNERFFNLIDREFNW